MKWLSCKPLNFNLKSVSQDTHVPCDVESVDITTKAAETTPYVEEVAQVVSFLKCTKPANPPRGLERPLLKVVPTLKEVSVQL